MAGSGDQTRGARTLLDKLWDIHVVDALEDGADLLHVDRILLHDLSGANAIEDLQERGLAVANPNLIFATPDHAVSTAPGRGDGEGSRARKVVILREGSRAQGIRYYDVNEPGQGIVHVIGPEQGITLPGVTLVCGDSHTCTHGGLGALAWGVGSSELAHAMVTQTSVQRRPQRMRVGFEGRISDGVEPKDLVLHLIGRIGAGGGNGYAVEYAGSAIRGMSIEGRMTVCNLSIELGARFGLVAPDDTTYEYVAGREFAPAGEAWDHALAHWQDLYSDDGAVFDHEVAIDAAQIAPQVTWGTSPEDVIAIDGRIPDPQSVDDPHRRASMAGALEYMALEPGRAIAGTPIQWVFVGSCTNARLSDLREAAGIARGRNVATGVTAWVVPGSQAVKRDAEAEGLDRIFREAGFDWREPGCAMCVAANGEQVGPGERCVSTTNRNFIGRQGPRARTHLASPKTAVASAIAGCIADVRAL